MAARRNKINHDEKTKLLMQGTQLINRLNSHANGEIDMTQSQVNAARIVISKSIPDLKAIEHTGEGGGSIKFELSLPFINQAMVDRNK
jgi:capsule polysaccharide export protein KpsE/RkpR